MRGNIMRKYLFSFIILISLTITLLLTAYFLNPSKNALEDYCTELYKYRKLVYSLIAYDGWVFLKRENPLRPIPKDSNIAAIVVGGGKIIISVLNASNDYVNVNFTVMFKYAWSEKTLISSAILKINTKTCYVYDAEGNFVGKWIYLLSSDIPVEKLELRKPVRNCTLVLANYHAMKFYGPCMKILREGREMIVTSFLAEEKIILDKSRNIVLNVGSDYYYSSKSKLLVRVEDGVLDDILYNVFGIYYIDHAYLVLIKAEKA